MLYVTGIHALNLPCQLSTCGDWHTSAIQWQRPTIRESAVSVWGNYGIEKNHKIPEHESNIPVANHIRALLDLIYEGKFDVAQGIKKDFICNDKYNEEIFSQIYLLKNTAKWEQINHFMHKEYGKEWRLWRDGKQNISS